MGYTNLEDDPFIFRYTDPTPWSNVGTTYLNAALNSNDGIHVGGGADAGGTTDSGGGTDSGRGTLTAYDWTRNFNIQVSTDNSTWTQVYPSSGNAADNCGTTTATFSSHTARYIKINQAITSGASNWWSMYEVNVWH
jgi:hypothetical protein